MNRPSVPREMKRALRQACGYGCVICGDPLYEIDHIVDYSIVRGHDLDNLALLCGSHHNEKSRGFLTAERVREARESPVNIETGQTRPWSLHSYGPDRIDVVVGSLRFRSMAGPLAAAVAVDGVTLIGVRYEHGRALLHALLLDERDQPFLRIVDNELVYRVGGPDMEVVGAKPLHTPGRVPRLIFRDTTGGLFVELNVHPPRELRVTRGRLFARGFAIEIEDDYVIVQSVSQGRRVARVKLGHSLYEDLPVGLHVGRKPKGLRAGVNVSEDQPRTG